MSFGLICPGQGDQSPAMWNILPQSGPAAEIIALAGRLLGASLPALSSEQLVRNQLAQPVVCALQLAVWSALAPHLPAPILVAGYSVGELAAYGCTGALAPAALIALAQRRASAMDEASREPGGLMAVRGLRITAMREFCRGHRLEIAIVNDLDRLVIGGPIADLAVAEADLAAIGVKVTRLPIGVASHCSAMAAAVPQFRASLLASPLQDSKIPVLAGIDGSAVIHRARAIDCLSLQLAQCLQWAACLDALQERGCRLLLELGPGNGLSRMVRERHPFVAVRSVAEFHTLDGVVEWVTRSL